MLAAESSFIARCESWRIILWGYSSLRLLCPLRKSHPKIQYIYHLFKSNLSKNYVIGKWAIFKKNCCESYLVSWAIQFSYFTLLMIPVLGFPHQDHAKVNCSIWPWWNELDSYNFVYCFIQHKVSVNKKLISWIFVSCWKKSISSMNVMIGFRWSCMWLTG